LQEFLVRQIQTGMDDIIRAARAVPEDRIVWSPGGDARSVLSQMQEIAMSGAFFTPVLRTGSMPELDGHGRREMARIRSSYDTLDKCVDAALIGNSELCLAVMDLTDDRLDEEVWLPLGGGMTLTIAEVIGKHAWNLAYHQGQINQIQLLLGDKQMH
jgi:hypothetical protein